MAHVTAGVVVLVTVAVGYLVGSVPTAALLTGRDLRTVGDRNPGYWNARESLGRRAAVPVFVADVVKGGLAAGVGVLLAVDGDWWLGYVGGAAAMLGHAWPVFAGFRGGRSVLCFVGTVLVVTPVAAGISVIVCAGVTVVTRRFDWGARIGVFGLPVVQIVVEGPYRTAATGCLMSIIGVRFALAAWEERRRTPGPQA